MLSQLTLKRASEAVGEAVAWFLPGEDPREWLATIASWNVATQACVFYPLADASGARPLGALVVPPAGMKPAGGGRVQGYRMVTAGFYVPVDAVLFPPVEPAELGALKRHAVLVWHPV